MQVQVLESEIVTNGQKRSGDVKLAASSGCWEGMNDGTIIDPQKRKKIEFEMRETRRQLCLF